MAPLQALKPCLAAQDKKALDIAFYMPIMPIFAGSYILQVKTPAS
jgi:hypothetical protein